MNRREPYPSDFEEYGQNRWDTSLFVEQLRKEVPELWVLEKEPRDGDLPADMAPEVIPEADLVALTSTRAQKGQKGDCPYLSPSFGSRLSANW